MSQKGLIERLENGENIIVAEGYIFEFERRGYLKAGSFVPQVVLEHPDLVKQLHQEYVHAGSDVVLAFTYYAHREKMRLVGKEKEIEEMNRRALRIAREVADDTGTLMAGNICNSTVYQPGNKELIEKTRAMFKEQVEWAVEENADFIVAETFQDYGEAALALEVIQAFGKGTPAVVTLQPGPTLYTADGVPIGEACKKLEDCGAAVVGLNCGRGPGTIIEALKEVKRVCKGPIAAVPVPYRTTSKQPTFFSITIPGTDIRAFPLNVSSCLSTREEVELFAQEAKALGAQYVGLCCGNSSHQLRIIAEVYGKHAPASDYAPEMEKHFIFGDQSQFPDYYAKDMRSKITAVFE